MLRSWLRCAAPGMLLCLLCMFFVCMFVLLCTGLGEKSTDDLVLVRVGARRDDARDKIPFRPDMEFIVFNLFMKMILTVNFLSHECH